MTRRDLSPEHTEWAGDHHGLAAHVEVQRAAVEPGRPRWHWLARAVESTYGAEDTRADAVRSGFAALRVLAR